MEETVPFIYLLLPKDLPLGKDTGLIGGCKIFNLYEIDFECRDLLFAQGGLRLHK